MKPLSIYGWCEFGQLPSNCASLRIAKLKLDMLGAVRSNGGTTVIRTISLRLNKSAAVVAALLELARQNRTSLVAFY